MLKVRAQELTDVVVLHLEGHIVRGAEIAMLRSAVFSQRKARVIALDLSQMNVLDAGGLSALLELREWARANGIEFRLVNLTKPVQRVFAITRLDSVFDISFQDEMISVAPDAAPAIVAESLLY